MGKQQIEEICNIHTWHKNKDKVMKFYSERRIQLGEVKPNKAHLAIAKLQKKYGKERVVVITQNVDDLFERAGCTDVLHLHGKLKEIKCMECDYIEDIGYHPYFNKICPKCGKESLKPNIVFFYEYAPNYHLMKRYFRQSTHNDIFVVIGTMGNVVAIDRELEFIYSKIKILNNLENNKYINQKNLIMFFFSLQLKL